MRSSKSIMTGVAVLAALALPMAAGAADTNNAKLVVKDSTGVTDRMVVTDMGRIGIGTSAPAGPIYVVSSGTTIANGGLTYVHTAQGATPATGAAPNFSLYRSNTVDASNGLLPRKDDLLGYFNFGTHNAGVITNRASIYAGAEKAWTSTDQPTYFRFLSSTFDGTSTAVTEKMRITSAGNIGVGTGAPRQKLEVNGGVRLNTATARPACDANARGTFWFTIDGAKQNDSVEICAYKAGVLGWQPLY